MKASIAKVLPAPAENAVAFAKMTNRYARVVGVRDSVKCARLSAQRGDELGREFTVTVKQLGGASIVLREGTSDTAVLSDTFVQPYHLPPDEITDPRVIVDLGSNIGLTIAHYAYLYPKATIVGLELDADTAAVARRNIAPWDDRCTIRNAAAWTEDGRVRFSHVLGEEWGSHVTGAADDGEETGEVDGDADTVEAVSLATLLAPFDTVDFLKVDIEGGEREVLKVNGGWADRVRAIHVEIHPPYSVAECEEDLHALGFRTREVPHPVGAVMGVRD